MSLSLLAAVAVGIASIGATGCATTVRAGSVGLIVHQTGADRGVQSYSMVTGRVWYNPWTTDIIEYPVTIQTVAWTADTNEGNPVNESITFTNKEGMAINADISASYQLDSAKAPYFYQQFKKDRISEFTDTWFRNVVRNAFNDKAGAYTVEQIMGDNAPLLLDVQKAVNAQTERYGIHVNELGFINAPRPPATVIVTINSKNQAEQLALQKQNEVAQAQADAKKTVAEAQGFADAARIRAQGQAEANRLLNQSLDSNLLAWKQLEKWDGVLPQVTSNGNGLLLSLHQK